MLEIVISGKALKRSRLAAITHNIKRQERVSPLSEAENVSAQSKIFFSRACNDRIQKTPPQSVK